MKTITVNNHSITEGDILEVNINNSFWKVFYHWVVQKNLRRVDRYRTVSIKQNSVEVVDEG